MAALSRLPDRKPFASSGDFRRSERGSRTSAMGQPVARRSERSGAAGRRIVRPDPPAVDSPAPIRTGREIPWTNGTMGARDSCCAGTPGRASARHRHRVGGRRVPAGCPSRHPERRLIPVRDVVGDVRTGAGALAVRRGGAVRTLCRSAGSGRDESLLHIAVNGATMEMMELGEPIARGAASGVSRLGPPTSCPPWAPDSVQLRQDVSCRPNLVVGLHRPSLR